MRAHGGSSMPGRFVLQGIVLDIQYAVTEANHCAKDDLIFVIMKFYETVISHIIGNVSMKKPVSREKAERREEQGAASYTGYQKGFGVVSAKFDPRGSQKNMKVVGNARYSFNHQ
ncbi:hypothetical protein WISP_94173 [Willisornis vidua]|uniref:Uncharacterized protein n=1 Tax=Willisornis vidua TaxID=1566151 RepID=A0ABQ9D0P7_9PASS|nr:hypothetical protein WISP_94173 [Willisornis vidua]